MPDVTAADINTYIAKPVFNDNNGAGPLVLDLTELAGKQTLADEMAAPIFWLLKAASETARAENKALQTYSSIAPSIRPVNGVPAVIFRAVLSVQSKLSYSVTSISNLQPPNNQTTLSSNDEPFSIDGVEPFSIDGVESFSIS